VGPLSGMRVLDLTSFIAGPFCGMILGDLGADVIKVEQPPGGDPSRHREDSTGYSAGFAAVNRNKRSILLDLRAPDDMGCFIELVAQSDALVTSLRLGARSRLGIDYDKLKEVNPRLVYLSISAFGESDLARERPGFDVTAQAESGLFALQGISASEPLRSKLYLSDQLTGIYGALGVLAALLECSRTGQGQEVSTSLLRASTAFTLPNLYLFLNAPDKTAGKRGPRSAGYLLETADGRQVAVHIPPSPTAIWERFVGALGAGHLESDPRFATKNARAENYGQLYAEIAAIVRQKDSADLFAAFAKAEVAIAPINDLEDVEYDPVVLAEELVTGSGTVAGQPIRTVAPGVKFAGRNAELRPAPLLNEHQEQIRALMKETV
jgi:crotonobetainyl-CoA:carnitine CoA-transferase CaiB-like acyl-CoA transferase